MAASGQSPRKFLKRRGLGLEKRNDRRYDQCEVSEKAGEELGRLGSRSESGLFKG